MGDKKRTKRQWTRARQCQLSHWGRVTHICVSKLTIIGSDNGLSPGRRQAIIWTNARILLIRPLGTNFNEILLEILAFSFIKMRLKVTSAKWRPFCLGLNVLYDIWRLFWWIYLDAKHMTKYLQMKHIDIRQLEHQGMEMEYIKIRSTIFRRIYNHVERLISILSLKSGIFSTKNTQYSYQNERLIVPFCYYPSST